MYIVIDKKDRGRVDEIILSVIKDNEVSTIYYDHASVKPLINTSARIVYEEDLFSSILQDDEHKSLYIVSTPKNKHSSALSFLKKVYGK